MNHEFSFGSWIVRTATFRILPLPKVVERALIALALWLLLAQFVSGSPA